MQTILGAGGAIGRELARALPDYTDRIRLVSRHPEKVNPSDELMPADLLDSAQADRAIEGSEVVYVTVGFPYKLSVWRSHWPVLINNVIDACMRHGSKLVFFDNIYMYDKDHLDGMTEETPINPPSKKGLVRADIHKKIMYRIREGELTALIARAADFYGPGIEGVSMLTETVFKPLSKGKKANLMGPAKYKHSYTYTPDAGRATALLGNSTDAWNQVWHLPTAAHPFTAKEWVEQVASAMDVKPKYQVATRMLVKMIGIFSPVMKEMPEMMYQYDRDYVFDSSKFEKQFNFRPTSYEDGINTIVQADYRQSGLK